MITQFDPIDIEFHGVKPREMNCGRAIKELHGNVFKSHFSRHRFLASNQVVRIGIVILSDVSEEIMSVSTEVQRHRNCGGSVLGPREIHVFQFHPERGLSARSMIRNTLLLQTKMTFLKLYQRFGVKTAIDDFRAVSSALSLLVDF